MSALHPDNLQTRCTFQAKNPGEIDSSCGQLSHGAKSERKERNVPSAQLKVAFAEMNV